MLGHLAAMVPGEGAAQLLRKPSDGRGQGRAHALSGEPVREWEQQPIAAVTLDQGSHRAGSLAEHQRITGSEGEARATSRRSAPATTAGPAWPPPPPAAAAGPLAWPPWAAGPDRRPRRRRPGPGSEVGRRYGSAPATPSTVPVPAGLRSAGTARQRPRRG